MQTRASKRKKAERSRGQVIRKGDDRYLIRVFVGRQLDGKRKYCSRTVSGTIRTAERELTKVLREIDTQTFVEPCKQTLAEYVEQWLTSSIRLTVSGRTAEDYAHRIRKDILTRIGHRQLHQLTMQEIQGCYAALIDAGLSARTVRYTHSILKQALKRAVIAGLLFRNPAEHLELPRQVRREMSVLTPDQVNRLLAVTRDHEYHALWSVLLLGGLRPGEALGLKWSDVRDSSVHIMRALKKGADDKYFLAEPKTQSSRRIVPLLVEATAALQAHRSRQLVEMMRGERKYERNDLVFANSLGRPMDLAKVRRLFKRALKDAELPQVRLYDSRHTHATLMLQAGINPKIVSERLGHTNIQMTLGTYSHVLPGMQEESVSRLETFLAAANAR
jgi:integrase